MAFIGMMFAISLASCDEAKKEFKIDYSVEAEAYTDGVVSVDFEQGYFMAGGDAHVLTHIASDYVPVTYITKAEIIERGDEYELQVLDMANKWAESFAIHDTTGGHYDITIHAYIHEQLTGLTLKADRHWDNNATPPSLSKKLLPIFCEYKEPDNDPYPYIF